MALDAQTPDLYWVLSLFSVRKWETMLCIKLSVGNPATWLLVLDMSLPSLATSLQPDFSLFPVVLHNETINLAHIKYIIQRFIDD